MRDGLASVRQISKMLQNTEHTNNTENAIVDRTRDDESISQTKHDSTCDTTGLLTQKQQRSQNQHSVCDGRSISRTKHTMIEASAKQVHMMIPHR